MMLEKSKWSVSCRWQTTSRPLAPLPAVENENPCLSAEEARLVEVAFRIVHSNEEENQEKVLAKAPEADLDLTRQEG